MAKFIEADVIQKIATEAEWLTQTRIPYKGQIMLVSDSSGKVTNIKVGDGVNPYSDLSYMFDSIQQNASFVPTIGNTLPTPSVNPAFTILGDGDYGSIPADTGNMRIATWDGSVWTVAGTVEIPMQDISGLATKEEAEFNVTELTLPPMEQGSISSAGTPTTPESPIHSLRIRSSERVKASGRVSISINSGLSTRIIEYDDLGNWLLTSEAVVGNFEVDLLPETREIIAVVSYVNNAPITPAENTGLQIHELSKKISEADLIDHLKSEDFATKEEAEFKKHVIEGFSFEQGSITSVGTPTTPASGTTYTHRIRFAAPVAVSSSSEINVVLNNIFTSFAAQYDAHGNFISNQPFRQGSYSFTPDAGTASIRMVVGYHTPAPITPEQDTDIEIFFQSAKVSEFDLSQHEGVPSGGVAGDVLTPEGWSPNYTTQSFVTNLITSYLQGYTTADEVATTLQEYVKNSDLVSALNGYATTIQVNDAVFNLLSKTDTVSNIAPNSVTAANLSQEVMDLLAASGATINNAADGEDLESVGGLLKLKGEGVIRFRAKETSALNYDELIRCKSYGLPIQIMDVIDLSHSNGDVRVVDLDGVTLKFVGNGRLKNCRITGTYSIIADRKTIFQNVHHGRWRVSGTYMNPGNSVYEAILNTSRGLYRYDTKVLSSGNTGDIINPFYTNFPVLPVGAFYTPTLEAGEYVYKEGGTTLLTFKPGAAPGTVQIPIRRDYVFTDAVGNILESTVNLKTKELTYIDIDPANLRVSRLIFPEFIQDGVVSNTMFPEWFGTDDVVDCSEALQNMAVLSGTFDFAANKTYSAYGDIRIYGDSQTWKGNRAVLKTLPNTTKTNFLNFEWRKRVDGNVIYDLRMDGDKSNQIIEQDGIFSTYRLGIYPFSGYGFNNSYWYNLDIRNFSGSGIFAAVPGTSHIYSSYLAYNKVDGLRFFNEHFTLTNVTCWENGRHGAWAGGNHFRIIGGAYAHNGSGNNLHLDGAFESQLIGFSCIHSGSFVAQAGGGYEASALNVYGYIYVGEGQGTHALVGGHGLYFKNSVSMMVMAGRIQNHNANGIHVAENCSRLIFNGGIVRSNNMTMGNWSDVYDPQKRLKISSSYIGAEFVDTSSVGSAPMYFGTSTQVADWGDIKTSLGSKFGYGTFIIRDSWNAIGRPVGANTNLFGTITIGDGLSNTVGRTLIELTSPDGIKYFRWVTIDMATGVYVDDTGWKTLTYS